MQNAYHIYLGIKGARGPANHCKRILNQTSEAKRVSTLSGFSPYPTLKHLKNNSSTKISLLLTLAPSNYPKNPQLRLV